ncbi:AAA family ATPase [Actinoplanes oblitus]|uniref:AAA family ATPase n=1 Tax=Actinoplanes oblitus TaxID=3040509 RepID=A0ABY8WUK7_9ACTN|nr:AAA family ATPase [Actinoplanes oblitus]WIN00394.1 AAA family ATPase [Actinoplanes oblitus]
MDDLVAGTPALTRLRWLLEGLSGRWSADVDVAGALDPGFAARIGGASALRDITDSRAAGLAPIRVVGVDADGTAATARFRTRDDDLWVSHVEVEPEAPHRITLTHTQRWVPDYLTPGLPADFTDVPMPSGSGAALIVFGGVPGSGKSTVSERVGAALDVPVFALDWLLGALSPFGMRHRTDIMSIGDELLTTLAYRELSAGRSAILDTTSEDPDVRARWASLASAAGAAFVPVVCACGVESLHRERVETRVRGIPGWADAGDWPNARARLAAFPPWPDALLVDTARPLEDCVATVLDHVDRRRDADASLGLTMRSVPARPGSAKR